MNIVKFKDTVAPIELEDAEWFNDNLRGKYAFWIRCRYIIPLTSISLSDAVEYEVDITALINSSIKYIDTFENIEQDEEHWVCGTEYWDEAETDAINDVSKYISLNKYVPDDDITMEELKNFRNWLATQMLEVGDWDDDTTHILTYYSNNMSDDVMKWLTYFGTPVTTSSAPVSVPCGCGGTSNISSLYNDGVSMCDTISIYRNNIKQGMINLFSNIDTWTSIKTTGVLEDIVVYLRNIITTNLPLVTEDTPLDTFSCKCLGDNDYAQQQAQMILENLIDCFNFIIEDTASNPTIKKNKNKIITTLSKWATNLYENMEWV